MKHYEIIIDPTSNDLYILTIFESRSKSDTAYHKLYTETALRAAMAECLEMTEEEIEVSIRSLLSMRIWSNKVLLSDGYAARLGWAG
jgi:hypothetical protein